MTITDDPVIPRTPAARCRIDRCIGAATTGGLCLFHAHQPGRAPVTPPPAAAPTPPPPAPAVSPLGARCPHCQKLCASDLGVQLHIEIKHPELATTIEEPAMTYTCTICGQTFSRQNGLTRHTNQSHRTAPGHEAPPRTGNPRTRGTGAHHG